MKFSRNGKHKTLFAVENYNLWKMTLIHYINTHLTY